MRKRVVVHGVVQGVFFRDTVSGAAEEHGVSGWVANRPDGTVEAVLEGPPDAVAAVVAVAREGPSGAHVERAEETEEEAEGLEGFEVR